MLCCAVPPSALDSFPTSGTTTASQARPACGYVPVAVVTIDATSFHVYPSHLPSIHPSIHPLESIHHHVLPIDQQRNMQSQDMQSIAHRLVPSKPETQAFDHRPGLSAPPPMSAQSLSPDRWAHGAVVKSWLLTCSLEGELKTPTSDTAPHQSLPLHLGGKPAFATQTQPAAHHASSRDEYFKGGTTNSSDYIIDIWNERINPFRCVYGRAHHISRSGR